MTVLLPQIAAPDEFDRRKKKTPTLRKTHGGATLTSASSPVTSALALLNSSN
jgi:hypothetical protein